MSNAGDQTKSKLRIAGRICNPQPILSKGHFIRSATIDLDGTLFNNRRTSIHRKVPNHLRVALPV